jgi:hypothetical protein
MTGRDALVLPVDSVGSPFIVAEQLVPGSSGQCSSTASFFIQLNVRAGIAGPFLCMPLTRVIAGGSPRSTAAASSSRTAFTKAVRWAESPMRSSANNCAAFSARNAISSGARLALALTMLVVVRGITCSSLCVCRTTSHWLRWAFTSCSSNTRPSGSRSLRLTVTASRPACRTWISSPVVTLPSCTARSRSLPHSSVGPRLV